MAKGTRAASAGFGLLLRRQYLLWWIFAVNFALAALATIPAAASIAGVMGHSFYSNRLVTGFDAGVLIELLMRPQVHGGATLTLFPLIFFFFMLLAEGGILLSYRQDRRFGVSQQFTDDAKATAVFCHADLRDLHLIGQPFQRAGGQNHLAAIRLMLRRRQPLQGGPGQGFDDPAAGIAHQEAADRANGLGMPQPWCSSR